MKELLHILVVMGEGGHSTECLRLIDLLGTSKYRYSYVLVKEDNVTEDKIRVPGRVYRVIRPRSKGENFIVSVLKYALCQLQAAVGVLHIRPDAVLTTGPGVALPVCLAAKVIRAQILFVETGSRIHELSPTGTVMHHIADLYFVQWQELLSVAPRAIFAGRLF